MSRQTREQRRNLAKEHDANNLPKHLQSDHRRRRGQRSVPAGHRTVSYLARAHLEERCSKCDFAFASAVGCSAQSDPFLAGVGSGFNLLFLIARNILSYSCCLQKHIQKHATVTRRRPQCRQSYSIGFSTRCIRSSSAPNTQR